jgi:cytochrome c-type biogenesis protein CcmF
VAIWSNLEHDLYMVLAGWDGTNRTATFKAYLNPLVGWIWIGGWVLLIGTIICMIPDRRRSNTGIQNY